MDDGPRAPAARRRPRRPRGVLVALAVVAAVGAWSLLRPQLAGTTPRAAGSTARTASLDDPAPALAGRTLAGGWLDLADTRGSVVLVTVWASWCAPCREELPVLVAAQRRLGPRGLRLVGIDHRDGQPQARALLAKVGGDPADSVVDPQGTIADAWQVHGVPETFVVDPEGRVRARQLGPVTAGWIERTVVPLLPVASG